MAWISVHDTIDGPKMRALHKRLGCSKFEATGILNYLWFWGLHNADKNGLILNADKDDIIIYFSGIKNGCTLDTADIVNAIIETGWIDEVDGELYLHDWAVWQKEWYKYQERLARDSERKRRNSEREEEKEEPKQEDKKAEAPKKKEVKKAAKDYSAEFVKFWEIYPRTDGKAEAYEKFCARLKEGVPPAELILAANNYAAKCRKEHTETKYTLQAKTFLGPHLKFKDYLPKEPVAQPFSDPDSNPFAYFTGG